MNSFGKIFKVEIFGESHGECCGIIIDGCPAGLSLNEDDFLSDLSRRKPGKKGTTTRVESDNPLIKTGLFEGYTTGAPILIEFKNSNQKSRDYGNLRYTPRPGHADFSAYKKYAGFNDYRGGGHFSGRITLGLVAAGVIAKKLINPVTSSAQVLSAGGDTNIERAVEKALKEGDSIGTLLKCEIKNIPAGLGEPFFYSIESALSSILFSVPGIKGVEFGEGFKASKMKGSEFNDPIIDIDGRTLSNNSGGINGGITNGNSVVFRVAMRPAPSISLKQKTVNLKNGAPEEIEIKGRHDACIGLRVPVILEACAAIVTADFMMLENLIPRRITDN